MARKNQLDLLLHIISTAHGIAQALEYIYADQMLGMKITPLHAQHTQQSDVTGG